MKIVIDIDGVLCDETNSDVSLRNPYYDRIHYINRLFSEGHEIIIFTSRGMKSTGDDPIASELKYRDITEHQLSSWGLNYTKLFFGKPNGDMYIDNKNTLMENFFDGAGDTRPYSNPKP